MGVCFIHEAVRTSSGKGGETVEAEALNADRMREITSEMVDAITSSAYVEAINVQASHERGDLCQTSIRGQITGSTSVRKVEGVVRLSLTGIVLRNGKLLRLS